MLKAGNLASREDHRVRGVKSGRTRSDRGISHVCVCLKGALYEGCQKSLWTPYLQLNRNNDKLYHVYNRFQ